MLYKVVVEGKTVILVGGVRKYGAVLTTNTNS
jgi:hypothetical protein